MASNYHITSPDLVLSTKKEVEEPDEYFNNQQNFNPNDDSEFEADGDPSQYRKPNSSKF